MSVTGPGGVRPDFGSADAADLEQLREGIANAPGTGRDSWWDGTRSTSRLAQALARDGKLDVADAQALIRDAKDFGNITAAERQVFVNLLRQHGAKVTPAAAEVLAQAFGVQLRRPTPQPPVEPPVTPPAPPASVGNDSITITGDQRNGLEGIAKPGDTIEAINLTTAPDGRLHLTDTTVIARADAQGKFSGRLPDMKEGDIIRLRTRGADGKEGEWLTIRVRGTGAPDTRNASVNLERMDLAVAADGSIDVKHNTARPLSEPGATIRFENVRTGEKVDVTVTDAGSLPAGFKLRGRAGDEFRVAVSDGTNNVDFATIAGSLRVPGGASGATGIDLPDPGVLKDDLRPDGSIPFAKTRFAGPLFIDGPKADDVRQGAIGDCYFPAALAAIAYHQPEAIRRAIKDNGDGTYTVRFYENGDKRRPKDIKVDGDLYTRSFGGPVYGGSLGGSTAPDKMELWFPLIEKAYAVWKGGYEAIGNGGVSGDVMTEVLGGDYDYTSLSRANKDRVFEDIKRGAERGLPMTAGTFGSSEAARYTNTGVYANHAYTVTGAVEENGTKYVVLRNPWGQSEPGWDGKNDGFFKLELDKFMRLYQSLSIMEG